MASHARLEGAELRIIDSGYTASMHATESGNADILNWILPYETNMTNIYGENCLRIAERISNQ